MRKNRTQALWQAGDCAFNVWIQNPATVQAEMLATLGFDAVTVDMQHGFVDYAAAVGLFTAISTTAATPLVRVRDNDPGQIGQVLDAGAYGVICPLVNTAREAEAFVEACRYPPVGRRSFGPMRATIYAGTDYFAHANETILAIAQIETATALEQLEEIVTVPGLDAVYVGSADLSLSLGGRPVIDHADPAAAKVHAQIVETAHRHGVKVGLHAPDEAAARRCLEHGADLVTLGNDHAMVVAAARRVLEAARADSGLRPQPVGTPAA